MTYLRLTLVSAASLTLLLSGCARTTETTETATVETTEVLPDGTVKKGVKTAARFVVGRVTGPPVRAAMAAESVAERVSEEMKKKGATSAETTVTTTSETVTR